MTFHQFNPSTDTLEVGTKIRLAGREGEITLYCEDSWFVGIRWSNGDAVEFAGLKDFPLLEIADKPAKPLTIDKRVKGEILCMMSDQGTALDKFITIEDYLNSLEET